MSDLFHEDIPFEFIRDVFRVMVEAECHVFQVLTKRHERLVSLAPELPWPSNIWIGVSVENQLWADRRIPYLKQVPATIRFLSCEPLLKAVDLNTHLSGIQWVIVGGESGYKARPMRLEWARTIRDQCVNAGVPFLFKQWGGRTSKTGGRSLDDERWDEYPIVGEVPSVSDSPEGFKIVSVARGVLG